MRQCEQVFSGAVASCGNSRSYVTAYTDFTLRMFAVVIIYGPKHTAPGHLERLRARGLGTKRSLARREFALGVEALHRFVEREPLRRVHECVFAFWRRKVSPLILGSEVQIGAVVDTPAIILMRYIRKALEDHTFVKA